MRQLPSVTPLSSNPSRVSPPRLSSPLQQLKLRNPFQNPRIVNNSSASTNSNGSRSNNGTFRNTFKQHHQPQQPRNRLQLQPQLQSQSQPQPQPQQQLQPTTNNN